MYIQYIYCTLSLWILFFIFFVCFQNSYDDISTLMVLYTQTTSFKEPELWFAIIDGPVWIYQSGNSL